MIVVVLLLAAFNLVQTVLLHAYLREVRRLEAILDDHWKWIIEQKRLGHTKDDPLNLSWASRREAGFWGFLRGTGPR